MKRQLKKKHSEKTRAGERNEETVKETKRDCAL